MIKYEFVILNCTEKSLQFFCWYFILMLFDPISYIFFCNDVNYIIIYYIHTHIYLLQI